MVDILTSDSCLLWLHMASLSPRTLTWGANGQQLGFSATRCFRPPASQLRWDWTACSQPSLTEYLLAS